MTTETAQTTPQLVRALKLRDLVLFNRVAVLGLRHLGTTAKFGPGSLLMWLIAAIFFFIPQGLAVTELSSRFPKEGGIYFWTKRALGEGHGFLCGWCYWINNVLYYPNLLISAAVIATFIFGKSGSWLSDSWAYALPTTLGALWIAVLINIVGLGMGKWLQNAGGVGTYVPGLILILLGAYGAMTAPPATELSLATLNRPRPCGTRYEWLAESAHVPGRNGPTNYAFSQFLARWICRFGFDGFIVPGVRGNRTIRYQNVVMFHPEGRWSVWSSGAPGFRRDS